MNHDEKGGWLSVFWTENNLKKRLKRLAETPISPIPASPAKEKHQSYISLYMALVALGQD